MDSLPKKVAGVKSRDHYKQVGAIIGGFTVFDAKPTLTPVSTCKFSKLISIHFLEELVERI